MTDAAPGRPALVVKDLSVRRGAETVLAGVSLQVRAGSIHAVVGPNGGGKSTLLAAILGTIAHDGTIERPARGPRPMGYVPQSFPVDPTLPVTVADFLALGRQRRAVCLGLRRDTRAAVERALATVALEGFADRPLGALSGGERQRVLLAHALDPPPDLLLLDEPLSAVDAPSAALLEGLLAATTAAHGTAVLMVSHDLDHVRRAASEVTLLAGRVRRQGPPADVLADGAAAFGGR